VYNDAAHLQIFNATLKDQRSHGATIVALFSGATDEDRASLHRLHGRVDHVHEGDAPPALHSLFDTHAGRVVALRTESTAHTTLAAGSIALPSSDAFFPPQRGITHVVTSRDLTMLADYNVATDLT